MVLQQMVEIPRPRGPLAGNRLEQISQEGYGSPVVRGWKTDIIKIKHNVWETYNIDKYDNKVIFIGIFQNSSSFQVKLYRNIS